MTTVIDAGVAALAFTAGERGTAARAVLAGATEIAAPYLILTETAQALIAVAGDVPARIDDVKCYVGIELAERLILYDDRMFVGDAIELARFLALPVAACLYLALALRFHVPLVSFDATLNDATAGTRLAGSVRACHGMRALE